MCSATVSSFSPTILSSSFGSASQMNRPSRSKIDTLRQSPRLYRSVTSCRTRKRSSGCQYSRPSNFTPCVLTTRWAASFLMIASVFQPISSARARGSRR